MIGTGGAYRLHQAIGRRTDGGGLAAKKRKRRKNRWDDGGQMTDGGGRPAEAEVDFCGHMPTKINA